MVEVPAEPVFGAKALLTVVCVKWGIKYDAEYVNKLMRGIRRHESASKATLPQVEPQLF